MKKTGLTVVCATGLALLAAGAQAGGLAAPVMDAQVIVQEAAGGTQNWVIPVLLVATLVAVIAGSGGGGGVGISDARLKTDIKRVGTTTHGLSLYQFAYLGQQGLYQGVMAQDVARVMPEAIVPLDQGYLAVNYDMLGLKIQKLR